MKNIRLAIVIPTRNRAALAAQSVESVLTSYAGDDVGVIISDNSTDISESVILDRYFSSVGSRVQLIRPMTPLGMTAHWNFAIDYAMSAAPYTHFTVLTDRMLFKVNCIKHILSILSSFQNDVLSYTYDRIHDADTSCPIIYRPLPRSGDLIRIESERLLAMSAHMSFPSCLPRMLNSVSPREHLNKLKIRFAKVFSSIAPDFNFCYRTLDICKSFVYYDRAVLINYSQGRSNGASFARGVMTRDSEDFMKNLDGNRLNECSPLPAVLTVGNSIVHEYCIAKRLSHSGKFPEISIDAYMDFLAAEVLQFKDAHVTSESLRLLRRYGWKPRLQFHLARWKSKMVEIILDLCARKFGTVKEAVSYACSHTTPVWAWFPHPSRGYGLKIPFPVPGKNNGHSNL